MSTVDTWLVQVAVYDALVAANVAGGRVYDHVPVEVTFPHVEIGEAIDLEEDSSGAAVDGIEHNLTLHVWSREHRGQKTVKNTVKEIRAALHRATLTVAGLSSCLAWVGTVNYLDDPDGVTRHGVVRVRLMCRA